MKKKLIALLVAALMVVTMLPAMALAEPAAQSGDAFTPLTGTQNEKDDADLQVNPDERSSEAAIQDEASDESETAKPSTGVTFKALNGSTDAFGKQVSEFVGKDLSFSVSEDNKIVPEGALNYITGFEAFNETEPDQQNGYYLPFGVELPQGSFPNVRVTLNGRGGEKDITNDPECLVLLPEDQEKPISVAVDLDGDGAEYGETVYTFDYSRLQLGEDSAVSITRDPSPAGGTGGVDCTFDDTALASDHTVKFTGTVDWYAADKSLGRTAGNRVGVEIKAPETITDFSKATVRFGTNDQTYTWEEVQDGDDFFWWYPLVKEDAKEFTFTIDWDGENGMVYAPTTYTVDCTGVTTLRSNAATNANVKFIDSTNWKTAQDVSASVRPVDLPWFEISYTRDLANMSTANKAALKAVITVENANITADGDHKSDVFDGGSNVFTDGKAVFTRTVNSENGNDGYFQAVLGELVNGTNHDFLGIPADKQEGKYTFALQLLGAGDEIIGASEPVEMTYGAPVTDDLVMNPEVHFVDESNYDKLGEDGGIFDPAHNDLPWIETTFQINKSMVKDPVNFEFEVKIENSHIVSGTTAAVDGGVPAGNAYSDGSATFTRTIDLSNSAAYQDPTRDTITLKYNAAIGRQVFSGHNDFLGIADANQYGDYTVTISAKNGETVGDGVAKTLEPVVATYGGHELKPVEPSDPDKKVEISQPEEGTGNQYVSGGGIGDGTKDGVLKADAVAALFNNPNGAIAVKDAGGNVLAADANVGTGCMIQLLNGDGTPFQTVLVVVPGDVMGTGVASIGSLVKMSGDIAGNASLDGAYLKAADINGDGKVSIGDVVKASKLI